jgi:hypothetical protein
VISYLVLISLELSWFHIHLFMRYLFMYVLFLRVLILVLIRIYKILGGFLLILRVASALWNALIESSERLRRAPRREDLAQQAHGSKHSILWPFKPPVFLSFEKKSVISSRFPDVKLIQDFLKDFYDSIRS